MGSHLAKARSATSDLPSLQVLGLRHFVPKSPIRGLSRCGRCSPTFQVWHPSPFAGTPAPFSNQGRTSQAEVPHGVTWAGYLFKDTWSLETLSAGSRLGVPFVCQAAPLPLCHSGFLISTWTLDGDQYCRHLGKEELLMRTISHLGELRVDRNQAKKHQQKPGRVTFLQIRKLRSGGSLYIRKPCAPNPVTRAGAKLEQAVSARL